MKQFKLFKYKRWFFKYYMPTRVIEEAYLSIPKDEWAILESVEGFSSLTWMILNVDRKLKNRHRTLKGAIKAVRVGIEYAETLKKKGDLNEKTMKRVCDVIFYNLFHE